MNGSANAILREFASGGVPPGIALMRLILATGSAAELAGILEAAPQSWPIGQERRRLQELAKLLRTCPGAWETVRATATAVSHDALEIPAEAMVQRLAQSFDAAARASPEASVALYSLGNAAQLERATDEIAGWLRSQGVLGPERELLDLGCGIGRLELTVAGDIKRIVGLDIAPEMIRIAKERCAKLGNVQFLVTSGLDLREHPDAGFDGVLAVDTFPYLVQAGGSLAPRHIKESARVLRPGGDLVILNYSYRGSPQQDALDLQQHAGDTGLELLTAGIQPLQSWDATVFRLAKPR